MSQCQINRIMCNSLQLRVYTVSSLQLVKQLVAIHQTSPNATIALGRATNAAALLSASLKPQSDQNLCYKIQGSGPLKEIQVQADARGNFRAYVANPRVDDDLQIDSIDFAKAIGAGIITITKDVQMKTPYSGVSPLIKGEIAHDTAYYLTSSEQVPSAIILGLNLDTEGIPVSSGGILIQTFPETPNDAILLVEENIRSMSQTLGDALLDGTDIISIASELLGNRELQLLSSTPIVHNCRCSKKNLTRSLRTVARQDLIMMKEEDHGAELTCTFCKTVYTFSEQELQQIIDGKDQHS
jgi:molecular chaperone Hsp33